MKKVFIKYNPYNLETELTVDGKKLAQNSQIGERILPGSRLQEWIEDLPKILIDEYNDTDFDIVFHGTLLDFEDLTEVFTQAFERGELTAQLDRIPAKETSDKEALIDEVFKEIQEGPVDELRDEEITNAFQHAKSSDFEVCVVATMSAGKSTLINAMLRARLMPSKQEACTAIITRIKDAEENDTWKAEVYSKDNNSLELWSDENFRWLSRRLTDILGVRTKVENCVLTAADDDELTNMLRKIVLQISPEASKAKIIALSQCFMKDMSTQQDESEIRQKLYVKWVNYIKGRGVR